MTLAPLSIGFVRVVESCSTAILMILARDRVIAISKSIASYHGLLKWGHGVVVLAIVHLVATLLLIGFLQLLFYLRLRWFKEMALSVIFAVLLLTILSFVWVPGIQFDLRHLQILLVYSVSPTVVSLILFVMYRILAVRLESAPDAHVRRNTKRQKLMSFAVLAFFLMSSLYGWYELRTSRDETIREHRVWQEQVGA